MVRGVRVRPRIVIRLPHSLTAGWENEVRAVVLTGIAPMAVVGTLYSS